MATGIDTTSFFTPVQDPIYSVSAKTVAQDSSTKRTNRRVIPPASNGNNQYIFNWGVDGSMARFDDLYLECVLKISAAVDGLASATLCAPAWNVFADLIQNIKLSFNKTGVEIFNSTGATYLADFTARMLKNFTIEQMDKMDFLFTPILDEEYIFPRANAPQYANGALLADDGATYVNLPAAGGAAAVAVAAVPKPLAGVHSGFLARYHKYVENATYGNVDNHLRNYPIRIPFSILFGIYTPIILKNLNSIQMSIDFKASVPLDKLNAAGVGVIRVQSCSVVTDDYIPTTGKTAEIVGQRLALESDNLCFLKASVQQVNWNSSHILLSSKKNVESMMLLQFSNQVVHNTADVTALGSCGQLCLFNSTYTATPKTKCLGAATGAGQVSVPSNIQISYGSDMTYPDAPVSLRGAGDAFDPVPIYNEYIKSLNKSADRVTGYPMSVFDFASTMPFLPLKINAPHAVKLHEPSDLTIRLNGAVNTVVQNNNAWCVVFEYQNIRILSSGSVQIQN